MHEPAGLIEATLQNEAVIMGIHGGVAAVHRQPAEDELHHDLGDALDSESAIDNRELRFMLIGEALKIFFEEKLDRTGSPLPVD